jgi:hypothetical protein
LCTKKAQHGAFKVSAARLTPEETMSWNPFVRIAILIVAVRMVVGCGSGSGMRLSITTTSLSDGTVGTAYDEMVQVTGGTAPILGA